MILCEKKMWTKIVRKCWQLKRKIIILDLVVITVILFILYNQGTTSYDKSLLKKPVFKAAESYENEILRRHMEDSILEAMKLDRGTGCRPPVLDPFAPEMMKHMKDPVPINCNFTDWVRCSYDKCHITPETLMWYDDVKCTYYDIITNGDHDITVDKTVPSVRNGYAPYVLVRSDHAFVKCEGRDRVTNAKKTYKSAVVGVRRSVEGLKESNSEMPYNLLVFGFDSISHNHVRRMLPEFYQALLQEYKAIPLQLYNIVGDGTPQALIPIFTGYTEVELPEVRKNKQSGSERHTVDEFPFLWKLLKEYGYRTSYLEDMPWIGTFTYRMVGFKRQPTDHYFRGFASHGQGDGVYGCINGRLTYEIQLDVTRQIMTLDKNRKFAFTFMADLSHDDFNLVSLAQKSLLEFMATLKREGVLENTVVVFMGDHGGRFGVIRNTVQGRQEERMPLMSFIFPPSFQRARPDAVKNFKRNTNVLTTPFDIHATFLDIMGLLKHRVPYRVAGSGLPRSMSLLEPIPESRSCSEAGVEPHWCVCLQWIRLQPDDPMYRKIAHTFVAYINNLTLEHRDKCMERTLQTIEWVTRQKPNEKLLSFQKALDSDGYVGKFGAPIHHTENYQVKLTVGPGAGVYEASLKVDKGVISISYKDISRVNKYGHEPDCISEIRPDLNMYCYCKNTLTPK